MAIKLVINKQGFYELRAAPGIVADEERRAKAVLEACGGTEAGYMISSRQGKKKPQGRWGARVFTATAKAMARNRKHNILVRAFGAARG